MSTFYDYRSCASLFGYAEAVHRRSGAVCQLCGCGAGTEVNFDLWRQFSVEHLMGEKQYGYRKQISAAIAERFPGLLLAAQLKLVDLIDEANTVSACQFCNSTTSRVAQERSMRQLILETPGESHEVLEFVRGELQQILDAKRRHVAWKLKAVRAAFDERVAPPLREARKSLCE